MQRKLIGLGIGSLGTITGLNFILKGENDDLSTKWIENREENLADNPEFDSPLPESVIKELKEAKEKQEALRKEKEKQEWINGLLEIGKREDARVVNEINTGKLRKWLINKLNDHTFSTKIISRESLDGMISSLSRKGNPTFFNLDNQNQIDWKGVKVAVDKYNEESEAMEKVQQ